MTASSYIRRLHATFDEHGYKQALPNATAADSHALIVPHNAGLPGYRSVTLVVNETVVGLYGTMPLGQLEALAVALTPTGER